MRGWLMLSDEEYKIYNNSPIIHWMLGVFNSHATGRRLELSKDVKLNERESKRMCQTTYKYESRDCIGELVVQELDKKMPQSSHLALLFVLIVGNSQNWRDNKAMFMLDDFITFKGEEVTENTIRVARRQLKEVMQRLLSCRIEIKARRSCAMFNLLVSYKCKNNFCTVEFQGDVIQALCIYPQLFPNWGGELVNPKSFSMVVYIYYRIKQDKKREGVLNINTKDLLSYVGIPYQREQVNNRRHKQLIVQPLLKAIDEIHLLSGETLKIEVQPYAELDDFLNSPIVVKYDEKVAQYYNSKNKKIGGELNGPKSSKPSQRVSKRAAR